MEDIKLTLDDLFKVLNISESDLEYHRNMLRSGGIVIDNGVEETTFKYVDGKWQNVEEIEKESRE